MGPVAVPNVAAQEAAVRLAELGFNVRPGIHVNEAGACQCKKASACPKPGKHPATDPVRLHGGKTIWKWAPASSDPEIVRRVFDVHCFANVRIATGPGTRVAVLDIDRHKADEDGFASLRLLELENIDAPIPTTPTAETPTNGEHRYLRVPEGFALPRGVRVTIAGGIELLFGQDATAPPSRVGPDRVYRWKPGLSPDDVAVADAPAWLLDRAAVKCSDRGPIASDGMPPGDPGDPHPAWAEKLVSEHFEDVQEDQVGWVTRCALPEAHTYGDAHPSGWALVANGWLVAGCMHRNDPDTHSPQMIYERVGLKPEMRRAPEPGAKDGGVADDEERFTRIVVSAPECLVKQYPKPRSIWGDGIFCAGDLGILWGKPGTGKTWLALQLALAAIRATPLFGFKTGDGAPLRVGVLELELHAFRIQDRLKALGITEADSGLRIVSRPDLNGRVDLLSAADCKALARWCRDDGLNLLTLDALSRIHTEDENSPKMGEVLGRLDDVRYATGTAPLLLHHEPKTSGGARGQVSDIDSLRGHSRLQSDPTFLLRLVKLRSGLRSLRFVKCNNAVEPEPLFLRQRPDGLLEVTDAPKKKGDQSRAKVLEALQRLGANGTKVGQIAEAVGLSDGQTKAHLNALAEEGKARKQGSGKNTVWLPASTEGDADA